jgi:hypothetical protein
MVLPRDVVESRTCADPTGANVPSSEKFASQYLTAEGTVVVRARPPPRSHRIVHASSVVNTTTDIFIVAWRETKTEREAKKVSEDLSHHTTPKNNLVV